MRKQRNKRGKLTRKYFTQEITEKPVLKSGKTNPHYPGHKVIVHVQAAVNGR